MRRPRDFASIIPGVSQFVPFIIRSGMPTTKSAKKALAQSEKKRSRNRHFSELYKESVKKFERAVIAKSGNLVELLSEVYSRIDTLAKKNIIHTNNAARKKSAFAKLLKSVPGADAPVAAKAKAEKKAPAKKVAPKAEKAPVVKKSAAPKAEKAPAAKKAPAKKAAPKK